MKGRRVVNRISDGRPLPEDVCQILSKYFDEDVLREILIFEGLPWYVSPEADAYTDRNRIYFRPGAFRPETLKGLALIGHEVAHVLQYAATGKWRFRKMYVADWMKKYTRLRNSRLAYYEIEFEKAAREIEAQIYSDLLSAAIEEGRGTDE